MFHSYSLDKKAIPMSLVISLSERMVEKGYSLASILEDTGLQESDFRNPDIRVTYRQRIRQISNVLAINDTLAFWLDTETQVSISDYGLLGYAMVSSETLGRAIQIAVKYHKTAGAMFDLQFFRDKNEAVLRLEHFLVGGVVGQYLAEEIFLGIAPLIELLLGKSFKPSQLAFNYRSSVPLKHYENAFNCDIKMDQQYCDYRFDVKFLDEKLAAADTNVARSCEEACRKLLIQMDIEDDLVSRICHLLLSTPGEFPNLGMVAESLSIGTRTLRRRLKELGTSYQKVLDDVKKELAIEYLQTTSLSVQEISDLLGYSEVTNFRRAFVKWVKLSPYQYRRQANEEYHGLL
jgi:AraC-like DNA-binding protein